jgi:hypothetical protein
MLQQRQPYNHSLGHVWLEGEFEVLRFQTQKKTAKNSSHVNEKRYPMAKAPLTIAKAVKCLQMQLYAAGKQIAWKHNYGFGHSE